MVELLEENEDAANIYMLCRGQIITAGDSIIDISFPAIKVAMDLYRVQDQQRCFEKVYKLFHHFKVNNAGSQVES